MSKFRQINKLLGMLAVLIAFFVTQNSWGALKTSTEGGDWSTITWSPAGAPGLTDNIVIATGHNVTFNVPTIVTTVADITIEGTGTLTINDGVGTGTLATTTLTLAGTVGTPLTSTQGTLTVTNLTFTGTSSDVTLPATPTSISGILTVNSVAKLILGGTFQCGSVQITAGILETLTNGFTVTGTTTIDAGAFLTSTGGTKDFQAAVNNSGTLDLTGATTDIHGLLTLTGGHIIALDNTITLSGASLTSSGTSTIDFGSGGTGGIDMVGLDVTAGSLTLSGAAASIDISGAVNVANTCVLATTDINFRPTSGTTTLTGSGQLTATSGSKTFLNIILIAAGTLDLSGTTTFVHGTITGATGIYTTATCDLTLDNTAAVTLPATLTALNSLTITKTGAVGVNLGSLTTITATLAISEDNTVTLGHALQAHDVTIDVSASAGNSTLTLNGFVLTAQGDVTLTGGTVAARIATIDMSTAASQLLISGFLDLNGTTGYSVITATNANNRITVGGLTDIGKSCTLTLTSSTLANTFTGAVTLSVASAILNLSGSTVTFGNVLNSDGIGTINTTIGTNLTFLTGVTIRPDILNLASLTLGTGQGFIIAHQITAYTTVTAQSGATLAFTATGWATPAIVTLNATGASLTVSSGGALNMNIITTWNTDASTNLTLSAGGAITNFPTEIANLHDLTITTAYGFTMTADMTMAGDLSITGAATLTIGAGIDVIAVNAAISAGGHLVMTGGAPTLTLSSNLTITGDGHFDANAATGAANITIAGIVSNSTAGIINFDVDLLATITIGGAITQATPMTGSFTTDNTTNLLLNGTGVVTLPAAITTLGKLRINKTDDAIVSLGGTPPTPRTIGTATTGIIITQGQLDLNGNSITLGNAASVITDLAAEDGIINTGASGAYISTAAGLSLAELYASNIGVTSITGTPTTFTVKRYPESSTIAGATGSVTRLYYITSNGTLATVTFAYATSELVTNSNTPASLVLFEANDIAFTNTLRAALVNNRSVANRLTATKGADDILGTTDKFYGMSNLSIVTAVNSGNWNVASNWIPAIIPTANDDVVINNTVAITIPAGYAAVANSIIIQGTGSLSMTGAIPTLTLTSGNFTISGAGTFNVSTATGAANVIIPGSLSNAGTINLTGAGTAVITIGGTITNTGSITTNSTTNLTLNGTASVVLPIAITTVGTLNISKTAGTVTQGVGLIVTGTMALTNAASFITSTFALTVGSATGNLTLAETSALNAAGCTGLTIGAAGFVGNLTNTGTGTVNLTGVGVSISGTVTNTSTGAITTTAGTLLVLNGTGNVTIPGARTLGTLTINKTDAATVSLGGATTIGVAGSSITVTKGYLNLNGYNLTLGNAGSIIDEIGDFRIINNSTSAYITTAAGCTEGEIENSGIGISAITSTADGFQVARYPESVYYTGVNVSIARIYSLTFANGPVTVFTAAYATADLGTNTEGSLTLYRATLIDFSVNNAPVTTTNLVANAAISTSHSFAQGTTYFITAASTAAFIATSNGPWNDGTTWAANAVPAATDDIIIPSGRVVTVPDGVTALAKSLTIEGSGSLLMTGDAPVLTLAAGGNLTINSTSGNAINTTATTGHVVITIPGNLTLTSTGTIDLSGSSTSNSIVELVLSGTFTNTGGGTITTHGLADQGTKLNLIGTTSMTLPPLTELYALTVAKTSATVYQGAANLRVYGNTTTVTSGSTYVVGDYNFTEDNGTTIELGAIFNGNSSATVSRTFTGVITLDGTLTSVGGTITNTITLAPIIKSTGVLTVNYSTTTFGADLAGVAAGATINALGANVTFTGTVTWTNLTLNTNSNTGLTFNAAQNGAAFNIPALTLKDLTLSAAAVTRTLAGNITLAGNFTTGAAAGILDLAGYTLTVNGTFTNDALYSINPSTNTSALVLNGPIVSWGLITDIADVNLNLTIGGSGTITPANMGTSVDALYTLVMNRAGANLQFAGGAAFAIGSTMTITAGSVTAEIGQTFTVTGEATIGLNGTLICNGATSVTFAAALTGTGTIDADGSDVIIVTSGNFTFTGNLMTSATTILTFSGTAATVSLPSSVTQLSQLRLLGGLAHNITLNNDLTLTAQIAVTNLLTPAIITVSGYKLTLTGGISDATGTIVATNSSTLEFGAACDFTNIGITEDNTTNLSFTGLSTTTAFSTAIIQCNNLTQVGANTVTVTATGLTVYGNLNVGALSTFVKGAFPLVVYGDFTSTGGSTLTGAGAVTLYGTMQGDGAGFTTGATTLLVINGTGSQFIMPSEIPTLGTLTLNRTNGMKLNANLVVGEGSLAVIDLVITLGDLDLNGYTITFATANGVNYDKMTETAGNTIINTGANGASNGYIKTPAAGYAAANLVNTGLGVLAISAGTYDIRRYPMTVPVPGVGLSTSRIYQVSSALPTTITLQYDNTELNSSASDLKLYTSSSIAFAIKDDRTLSNGTNRTVNANTPVGKGNVAYNSFNFIGENAALAAGHFYALASVPGNGGVMYTYSGTDNGSWNTSSNWTPNGIPGKLDQVVIGPYTVVLSGESNVFECKILDLNHSNATLLPYNNTLSGDNVSLRVMGRINLASGAEILGVNGKGRINLIIGDGITTGVSSVISVNNDYVPTNGIWVNNLTINMADVTFPSGYFVRISGDVTLLSNCAVSTVNAEFWGGYNATQTMSIPSSAIFTISNAIFANSANVTTASSFNLANQFLVKSGSTFNATNGTALFTTANGSGTPWNVENGAALKLFNVEFNSSVSSFIPLGTVYIKGSFYQYGSVAFAPTSGTVIFQNTSQKEIVNSSLSNPERLIFYNLQVATGSNVTTSNNWQVRSEIDVKVNGSLIADNGTIYFVDAAPASKYIKNASTHTLDFNNLTLADGITYTSDSWTIKGNLTSIAPGGDLIAQKGTITFENVQEKTIDDGNLGVFNFFKILVADGSILTTSATTGQGDFFIVNNATNPTGAGIEVVGNGNFHVGSASAITTFNAGPGVAAGYSKTITKSSAGTLEFGNLVIAASTNNEVSSASDFTITGAGASSFSNAGAGGKFTATAGTVIFTGATPQIESVSPAVTQFYSIKTQGTTALTFPSVPTIQEFYIAGNITIDGTSSIDASDGADTKMVFNGTSIQTIGGSSTASIPIRIPDLVLNKTNGSEVLMAIDVVLGQTTTLTDDEMTLTNGILNLGSNKLTVYSDIISRTNGAINGAAGTYIIGTNHQTPKLEDVYFTVDGTPTLYNLTVNVSNETANDLTVNGTLNLLYASNFTIGSGLVSTPVKLILNGNITRTTGLIIGDKVKSRLVLQGSGSVPDGLSNAYFTSPATATTVQLEIARQESLGGNLNIATTSNLRVNTGINTFDIGAYTLTFNDPTSSVSVLSGGIGADSGKVVLNTGITTLPASIFRDNTVKDLTLLGDISLGGNLTVTGTLSGLYKITTNDNLLTFGPNVLLPTYTGTKHIVGNLRRTVDNAATTYSIGDGSEMYPVTMKFANSTSSQLITTSIKKVNPVYGRGGNAKNAVKLEWTFTPEGTTPLDSMNLVFQYSSTFDGSTTPNENTSFPAKWMSTYWLDYRNYLKTFTASTPRVLTMASYPLQSSEYLSGTWGIFTGAANTNAAKDSAISINKNKIVIKSVTPAIVMTNSAFKVAVELQDPSGRAITLTTPFAFTLSLAQGSGLFAGTTGVIPAGSTSATMSGLVFTGSGTANQLLVDTTGSSVNWNPGLSNVFSVLPIMPSLQASGVTFAYVDATSMTISWTPGFVSPTSYDLVVIKADTLLLDSEYPVGGTSYYANTIMGAGSSLGTASVIANVSTGGTQSVNVSGLSPNTYYAVYVFNYSKDAQGNERYRTTAASGNPKSQTTSGSYDDDVTLGTNNTRATSKTIGTKTPFLGTIKTADDVDWFNFTVTSASPNIRGTLVLTSDMGNYNVELYNMEGRRMRRGTRLSYNSEAQVINYLPAGTYTVKVMGINGAYSATKPYSLKITTSNNEIFSVTP